MTFFQDPCYMKVRIVSKSLNRCADVRISNVQKFPQRPNIMLLTPQTNRADTWCRCADRVARMGFCVGPPESAKCGNLGESLAAAGHCIGTELVDRALTLYAARCGGTSECSYR